MFVEYSQLGFGIMGNKMPELSPQAAKPVQHFENPIQALLDICASISAPDPSKLQNMIQNYKVTIDGKLWYSSFAGEWRDFYNLENLLGTISKQNLNSNPALSKLCSTMLEDINGCHRFIDIAVESRPNRQHTASQDIERSLHVNHLDQLYKRLKSTCRKLNNHYSQQLWETSTPRRTDKQSQSGLKDALLTDDQLKVWNQLNGKCLTAKEIASELNESNDDAIRKRIEKRIESIRKTLGTSAIKNTRGRGYWRDDARPLDAITVSD